MLNNQIYRPAHLVFANLVSLILYPYYAICNFFRTKNSIEKIEIKTILVTEYHRIGDILIIAQPLDSIKKKFPNAKLVLVCHQSAAKLAEHLGLADEVLSVMVPWTNWNWSLIHWIQARSFARQLRKKEIDLAFDFKGDLRNAWFLWQMKPKVSFGYLTTGGKYFFTNSFKMDPNLHQSIRAEKLISAVGCKPNNKNLPKSKLNTDGMIAFHMGTSDSRRSWPVKHWLKLAKLLSSNYQISLVKTSEASDLQKLFKNTTLNIKVFQGDLIEFKNWLENQRCLISPDSMAGHLAAHVGIPVFTIFGSQNPNLTRPISNISTVIAPDIPCEHQRSHWRLCQDCMESVSPKKVAKTIINKLSSFESQ